MSDQRATIRHYPPNREEHLMPVRNPFQVVPDDDGAEPEAPASPGLGAHPVAELFPMLAGDDLAELAEDIRHRGLLQPIVLDGEGRILDGRNRHAACLLAGVEPTFVTYTGDDADGYALAVNIVRRNLSTGAKAIIAAKAARLSGIKGKDAGKNYNLYFSRLAEANAVLDWSANGDLADSVLAGEPLSVALKTARERKEAAKIRDAKLARLRSDAPDLAELVDESRMGVDDAVDTLEGRIRRAAEEAAAEAERARLAAEAEAERAREDAAEAARRAAEVRGITSLRDVEPGLADDVAAGKMTLSEAEELASERSRMRRVAIAQVNEWLGQAIERLGAYETFPDTAVRDARQFDHRDTNYRRPVGPADLKLAAAGLTRLAELWEAPK